ncbi:MAG: AGE family epimerase/isomerase, partial [Gemmatimonadota bacterium]|nr:AGE family epimerase/isomerase [Gemmatimonadota bacterium]
MPRTGFKDLLEFYNRELFGNIMRFWMKNGIDSEQGGFFTCFSNDGSELLHKHKFTWSQGRFVWLLSRLYSHLEQRGDRPDEREEYLAAARDGAKFLIGNARLENGNCAFILDETGKPILLDENGQARAAAEHEGYDLSIYADYFVIYGLGEYARASGDRPSLDYALDLYDHTLQRIESGRYRTDPYPVPTGYKVHSLPMILTETAQELAGAAGQFGLSDRAAALRATADKCVAEIMENFRQPDRLVLEMIGMDNRPEDTLLGTFINPGHTIEDMWFIMHRALANSDRDLFARCTGTIKKVLETSWDERFGGLPLFLDRSGQKPQGELPPELENHVMAEKVRSDWQSKLWWVHSETLYALLLAYGELGEQWALDWYWKAHDYTFRTFPNPDRSVGE